MTAKQVIFRLVNTIEAEGYYKVRHQCDPADSTTQRMIRFLRVPRT